MLEFLTSQCFSSPAIFFFVSILIFAHREKFGKHHVFRMII
jgi:hypothetical protein